MNRFAARKLELFKMAPNEWNQNGACNPRDMPLNPENTPASDWSK